MNDLIVPAYVQAMEREKNTDTKLVVMDERDEPDGTRVTYEFTADQDEDGLMDFELAVTVLTQLKPSDEAAELLAQETIAEIHGSDPEGQSAYHDYVEEMKEDADVETYTRYILRAVPCEHDVRILTKTGCMIEGEEIFPEEVSYPIPRIGYELKFHKDEVVLFVHALQELGLIDADEAKTFTDDLAL